MSGETSRSAKIILLIRQEIHEFQEFWDGRLSDLTRPTVFWYK